MTKAGFGVVACTAVVGVNATIRPVPCPVCTSPDMTYPCPRCVQTFASRRSQTSTDLRNALTRMADAAAAVTTKTTYVGPDGARRLIRELYPQSKTCALAEDIAFTRPAALSRIGLGALVVAVHADHQVAQQFDVLTKELRVLADLTIVPTGYHAAPGHLRTVLHTAAVIILMSDLTSTPARRIGYGVDHALDHFSQRRRDSVALDDQEDRDTIDEIVAELGAYAKALDLTLTKGRIRGLANTDTARVKAALTALGADERREYADLSSAVHGRRRGQLARIDQVGDTGDSDADLMAVTLLWAMRSLHLASRAITALAVYAGADDVRPRAAALVARAMHILAYVGQREADVMDADSVRGR